MDSASKLQPGAWLRTSAGTYVQISAVQVNTIHQRVRNLTVADIHTYYVVASRRKVDSYWRVFKVMP
jgi:hypothetical protein